MKYFNILSEDEIQTLQDSFSWILLLLSVENGQLGETEKSEAEHTVKVRGYEENHLFFQFYDRVSENFDVNTQSWMERVGLSPDSAIRYEELLGNLNPILSKLTPAVARRMYKDLLSYTYRIANASGGFLGFGRISKAEKSVINLPMINPISPTEEEE